MTGLDQELAALIEGDPGVPPSPPPDPDEMGIDEGSLNGAGLQPEAPRDEIAIVTAQAFAAVKEPGADPLLGDAGEAVIPEGGDAMLYGDGGASKTTLSIDLACHLAAGDPWLGIPVPKPVRVLLIEAEGPRPLFREKVGAKLGQWQGSDLGDRLLIWERPWADFSFPDSGGIPAQLAAREIDVLIVGPLTRVGMDELGTLQEVRDFTAHVARFRAETGRRLTVLLVHHESKSGAVSGAWEGAGDTLLHAQVYGPGKTTLTFQKARWASEWHKRTVELGWTPGEGFEVVNEGERDYAAETAALLADGEWRTVREIASAKGIGAGREQVEETLRADPERFASRSGAAAKEVGRHPNATVWSLASAEKPDEPDSPNTGLQGVAGMGVASAPALKGQTHTEPDPTDADGLASMPEPDASGVGCATHSEPVASCRYCRGATP